MFKLVAIVMICWFIRFVELHFVELQSLFSMCLRVMFVQIFFIFETDIAHAKFTFMAKCIMHPSGMCLHTFHVIEPFATDVALDWSVVYWFVLWLRNWFSFESKFNCIF